VIPVRDDIEASLTYLVRRGVKEAIEAKADALVIHMNTNGGRVDHTEEIIETLNRFPHRDRTYTYIDTKAFSAGAFIASATRHIYMAPTGVIGAAAPVVMSPGGEGPSEMPKSIDEKMKSAVRALVRANAEQNGHNPLVFDAMVDMDQGLTIDGVEIVPKGKLLTLTSTEAARTYGKPPKPLLSAGTYPDLDALIASAIGPDARIVRVEPTGFEKLARLITMISPFLLTAAFLLGYIEFKTPGFGLFGIGAVLCALVFFFGHMVAGLSGQENLVFFFVGVVLIIVELFLFPGTLIAGLTGFTLILFALLRAMADLWPEDGLLPSTAQLTVPLANLGLAFVLSILGALLFGRVLTTRRVASHLVLATTSPGPAPAPEIILAAVGDIGKTLTPLRPSGRALFQGQPLDVVSEGDFIPAGTDVRVIRSENNHIVVAPV
jgi:membrane-bound serine protease (ClpP class)